MRGDDRHLRLSKLLSLWLRHNPDAGGLTLDAAGWTDVDDVLAAYRRRGLAVDRAELEGLVRDSDKQRFALDGGRIRANQGHSVPVELGLATATPPPALWHGTSATALPAIRRDGLTRQRRHHVHLSADVATARRVGRRRAGEVVVLRVDAAAMAADGAEFLVSANGVWLVDAVPPRYLGEAATGTGSEAEAAVARNAETDVASSTEAGPRTQLDA
ncbi:MAG TPA: RNA 2'-phosphotransferase [Pseudonocardiaceae bacterium]